MLALIATQSMLLLELVHAAVCMATKEKAVSHSLFFFLFQTLRTFCDHDPSFLRWHCWVSGALESRCKCFAHEFFRTLPAPGAL